MVIETESAFTFIINCFGQGGLRCQNTFKQTCYYYYYNVDFAKGDVSGGGGLLGVLIVQTRGQRKDFATVL